ncbi:MAG: hypothetical protein QXY45_02390 [Candidatus Aenigmatarchaeota archaeon]
MKKRGGLFGNRPNRPVYSNLYKTKRRSTRKIIGFAIAAALGSLLLLWGGYNYLPDRLNLYSPPSVLATPTPRPITPTSVLATPFPTTTPTQEPNICRHYLQPEVDLNAPYGIATLDCGNNTSISVQFYTNALINGKPYAEPPTCSQPLPPSGFQIDDLDFKITYNMVRNGASKFYRFYINDVLVFQTPPVPDNWDNKIYFTQIDIVVSGFRYGEPYFFTTSYDLRPSCYFEISK